MISYTMKNFLKDMLERSIKSFAQGMLTYFTIEGLTMQDIDWGMALSTGAVMAIYSVLTSIASYKVGDYGTAGLTKQE